MWDSRGEAMSWKRILNIVAIILLQFGGLSVSCTHQTPKSEPLTEANNEFLMHLEDIHSGIDYVLILEFITYVCYSGIDYMDDEIIHNTWREIIPFNLEYPNFIIIDSSNHDRLIGKYSFIGEIDGEIISIYFNDGLNSVKKVTITDGLYKAWVSHQLDINLLFTLRCLISTSISNSQDICDVYSNGLNTLKYYPNSPIEYYTLKKTAQDILELHNFICDDSKISFDMSYNGEVHTYNVSDLFKSIISSDLLSNFNEDEFNNRMNESTQMEGSI